MVQFSGVVHLSVLSTLFTGALIVSEVFGAQQLPSSHVPFAHNSNSQQLPSVLPAVHPAISSPSVHRDASAHVPVRAYSPTVPYNQMANSGGSNFNGATGKPSYQAILYPPQGLTTGHNSPSPVQAQPISSGGNQPARDTLVYQGQPQAQPQPQLAEARRYSHTEFSTHHPKDVPQLAEARRYSHTEFSTHHPKDVPHFRLESVGHVLSKEEAAEYERDFQEYDSNRDLLIDAQELRQAFRGIQVLQLHKFFGDIDSDESGTISLDEYKVYAMSLE